MADSAHFGAHTTAELLRREMLDLAQQAIDFAAPNYGPAGGHKLVVDDEGQYLLDSAASALREVHITDPVARPYKALATQVQASVGDGGTTAVLLAARLVKAALQAAGQGLPLGAALDGYRLARRQALSLLSALTVPNQTSASLAHWWGREAAQTVLDGLRDLVQGHALNLDAVDIRCEGTHVRWAEGLLVEPTAAPETSRLDNVRVLVLGEGPRVKLQHDVGFRVRGLGVQAAMAAQDSARDARWMDQIQSLGVGLLACRTAIEDDLAQRLASRGIVVCNSVPTDLIDRFQIATGATMVPRMEDARAEHLGEADLRRRHNRRGGWLVRGPGPAATLHVPGQHPVAEAAAIDAAERFLRQAGAVLEDGRAIPGGGAWQRSLAAKLRKASAVAPGKSAIAVRHAAQAFDELADDLARNAGRDPLNRPPPAADVWDSYPCTRQAIDAAFQVAEQILRLDGRITKVPSSPEGLRGPGKIGSPRGMPGDVPPLM